MSKMSLSFSLNVMLSMSKMSKIDQIHLRAVMPCMLKTHIFANNFLNIQLIFNLQKVLRS